MLNQYNFSLFIGSEHCQVGIRAVVASSSAHNGSFMARKKSTTRGFAVTSCAALIPVEATTTRQCEFSLRFPVEDSRCNSFTCSALVRVQKRGSCVYSDVAVDLDHQHSGAATNDASTATSYLHLAGVSSEFSGINLCSNDFTVLCE